MSSGCYVYAIVGRNTTLPTTISSGLAELTVVPWRGLAAVTGRITDDAELQSMEAVLRHEAVVEAVRKRGPSLPVRFGTVFRDAKSVSSALAARYDQLTADLDRLGDKVELSLTAMWSTPPEDAALDRSIPDDVRTAQSAGARYMRARAEQLRREEALMVRARVAALWMDDVFREHALDRHMSILPTPRIAFRIAYLLEPSGVIAFRSAFDTMHRKPGEVRVLLTGPWPPYSFVRRTDATVDN